MKVEDFEQAVWEVESIRVVVRAPVGAQVSDYSNSNAADEKWGVEEWLRKRVRPKLSGKTVIVVAGDGEEPHGRTLLRTLRNTYGRS